MTGSFSFALNGDGQSYYLVKYEGSDRFVEVLNEFNGYPVTSIGENAFKNNEVILTVVIPESIIDIGESAFSGTSNLTSLVIPLGVKVIGKNAFAGASSLTSLDIPNSVTTIGDGAFRDMTSLMSIEIPNNVLTIGANAFSGTNNLASMTLPFIGKSRTATNDEARLGYLFSENSYAGSYIADGYYLPNSSVEIIITDTTIIGNYGFGNNHKLNNITFGTNSELEHLGNYAFYSDRDLVSIELPKSLKTIGDYAFSGAESLETILIPNNVESLGNFTFYDARNLESITFEENSSLTSIGDNVFERANKLTSIEIPKSVESIGKYAFLKAESLTIYSKTLGSLPGWDPLWNYSSRPVYWKNQWYYDQNGKPTPL